MTNPHIRAYPHLARDPDPAVVARFQDALNAALGAGVGVLVVLLLIVGVLAVGP